MLARHQLIVIYKTAYYSFYLPVACAMLICGIPYPDKEPKFDFLKGGFGGGELVRWAFEGMELTR